MTIIELGYHLCYGDAGHKHFVEPEDASKLVEVTHAISAGVGRLINWIHMPVPRNRTDDAYFAPLRQLLLHPETELYLGLVHFIDGVEGTRRRIAAAQKVVADFGVATECGMGRLQVMKSVRQALFITVMSICSRCLLAMIHY